MAEKTDISPSNFLKIENNSVIFKGTVCRAYIPEVNFKRNVATIIDTDIQTMGIFKLYIFNDLEVPRDIDRDKADHILLFKLPMTITMCPVKFWTQNVIEESDSGNIDNEDGETRNTSECVKYYVLEFHNESTLIKTLTLVKDIYNVKSMLNIIFNNQLPREIGYVDGVKMWMECSEINGYGALKSNSSLLEMIISTLYRNPTNLAEPFRVYINKNPNAINDFKSIRLVDIPKYVSAFGSISSGDPVRGITSSIVRQEKGQKDDHTPIEEHIK